MKTNIYRVIRNDCRGFNNLSYTMHLRQQYLFFFNLIEQHSKFLLHTLQMIYICTLCDSTNINTIIEFVPHVSGDGFSGGSDSYFQFRIHKHPVSCNCAYHLRMELSDGGYFPKLVRNCRWTVVPRQSFWITRYIWSYLAFLFLE